jgi:hypothetical protein
MPAVRHWPARPRRQRRAEEGLRLCAPRGQSATP